LHPSPQKRQRYRKAAEEAAVGFKLDQAVGIQMFLGNYWPSIKPYFKFSIRSSADKSSDTLTDAQIAVIVIGCVSALVVLGLGIAAWKSAKRKKTIEYERARIAEEEGDSVPHAIIVQKQDAAVEAMKKKKKKSRGHWLNNWEWF
jgi:hypothetical protein